MPPDAKLDLRNDGHVIQRLGRDHHVARRINSPAGWMREMRGSRCGNAYCRWRPRGVESSASSWSVLMDYSVAHG
jgi:hypothetical protein